MILLSQYVEPSYVRLLLAQGTERRGYLLKERVAEPDDLMLALRDVAKGGSAIDPKVIEVLSQTRQILPRHPGVRLVLVSTDDPIDLASDVATCGAVGFVRKDEIGPETLATLLSDSPTEN